MDLGDLSSELTTNHNLSFLDLLLDPSALKIIVNIFDIIFRIIRTF